MPAFETVLQKKTQAVEALLAEILSPDCIWHEGSYPDHLLEAMRYGVLGAGKRLRPFLLLEVASLFDGDPHAALQIAAALELVHCYSLIHDDLPAMDDDALRRGQPTVHKKFDEATAILAGDALLTLAFEVLTHLPDQTPITAATTLRLIGALARAGGINGMVGGQMLDLHAENRPSEEAHIRTMQAMKTGALIRYACEAGAIVGGANEQDIARLAEFGSCLGLAFQLADDLLDMTEDTQTLGKTAGKDVKAGKATLPALKGQDWARQELDRLVKQACDLLTAFGTDADILRQGALFIIRRKK